MGTLMEREFKNLQYGLRIVPITTKPGGNTYKGWNDEVHAETVEKYLESIASLLKQGWIVLGWQNQNIVENEEKP